MPQLLQVAGSGGVQLRGLGLLLAKLRYEPRHLLLERLAVVLFLLRADVATRREHVPVLAQLIQLRALAEAGNVLVLAGVLLAAPGMAGARDPRDVVAGSSWWVRSTMRPILPRCAVRASRRDHARLAPSACLLRHRHRPVRSEQFRRMHRRIPRRARGRPQVPGGPHRPGAGAANRRQRPRSDRRSSSRARPIAGRQRRALRARSRPGVGGPAQSSHPQAEAGRREAAD